MRVSFWIGLTGGQAGAAESNRDNRRRLNERLDRDSPAASWAFASIAGLRPPSGERADRGTTMTRGFQKVQPVLDLISKDDRASVYKG
jgi:hypothetical protein